MSAKTKRKPGAKTIIRELLALLEMADCAGIHAQANKAQKTAEAFLARKPAKRMARQGPPNPAPSPLPFPGGRQEPRNRRAFNGDSALFTDDSGKTIFEVTLTGKRLRVFAPRFDVVILPVDQYCVELAPATTEQRRAL